jgi:hypothetical protein
VTFQISALFLYTLYIDIDAINCGAGIFARKAKETTKKIKLETIINYSLKINAKAQHMTFKQDKTIKNIIYLLTFRCIT